MLEGRSNRGPAGLLLLLVLLFSVGFTEFVLYSRNTLQQHSEWKLGKQRVAFHIMGSDITGRTRNLLFRNQLHLGVWHGFQELYYYRPLSLRHLTCDFRLKPGSVLTVYYAVDANMAEGVRLSRREGIPNAHLVRDRQGRFVSFEELEGFPLSDSWHRLEMDLGDDALKVFVDAQSWATLQPSTPDAKLVGFAGQAEDVVVDNVKLRTADGEEILESFENTGFTKIWIVVVFLCLLGCTVVGGALKRSGHPPRAILLRLSIACFGSLGILVLFFVFDYGLWSKRYPYQGLSPWGNRARTSRAEIARVAFFDLFGPLDRAFAPERDPFDRLMKRQPEVGIKKGTFLLTDSRHYPVERFEDKEVTVFPRAGGKSLRILLIGTSQTWGSGAIDATGCIQVQLYELLTGASEGPVEVFNASFSGSNSFRLLGRFEQLRKLQPDIVVFNLSNNDQHNTARFAECLQEMVAICRDIGSRPMFFLEANCLECPSSLEKGHRAMGEVAKSNGIEPVDVHRLLGEKADSGKLWWDNVHLSSYGQSLVATRMAEAILASPEFNPLDARGFQGKFAND